MRRFHRPFSAAAVVVLLFIPILVLVAGECPDTDGDGVCDEDDNCPDFFNPDQIDTDGDGLGDACDPDDDNDGIPDVADPCPLDPTNSCDCTDSDSDGICDEDDNCPFVTNPDQEDFDQDGVGDLCDNCPDVVNADQSDADEDGLGDVCDPCTDTDGDGCGDPGFPANTCCADNCPLVFNPDQTDTDNDGVGDACDPCPEDPDDGCCEDTDADGICDDLDNCPFVFNPDQIDTDGDGLGDACDDDDDNDGVLDLNDADPLDPFVCRDVDADTCDDCAIGTDGNGPLPDYDPSNDGPDFDGDGQCDAGDADDDNDGIPDAADPCPLDPTNTCDCPDGDSDGICDPWDNCPFVPNPDQEDTDGDGLGDACDCAPEDPQAGSPPEVAGLSAERLGDGRTLYHWLAAPRADRYDVLSGDQLDPLNGACRTAADPDPRDLEYVEAQIPLPGECWWLLIRGVDDLCGPGPWGPAMETGCP
jgi:hypothetical protein